MSLFKFRSKNKEPESGITIEKLVEKIKILEVRVRKNVGGGISSSFKNVFRGHGLEFSQVREYYEGDDVRLIDWNVSARLGGLHVKQLLEERELNVIPVIQCTHSMNYGTGNKTKYMQAAEIAAAVVFSSIHAGDRPGLLTFASDGAVGSVSPGKGPNHGFVILDKLVSQSFTGEKPDYNALANFLIHGLRKKCVIFLIGDFIYSDFNLGLFKTVSCKHDLICIGILDKTEKSGPEKGYYEIANAKGKAKSLLLGSRHIRRYVSSVNEKIEQCRNIFEKCSADYLFLEPDSEWEPLLRQLFRKRVSSRK